VAHNAQFDWGFVSQTTMRERGIEIINPQLCTVKLSRIILPNLPSKSLGPVATALNIRIPNAIALLAMHTLLRLCSLNLFPTFNASTIFIL